MSHTAYIALGSNLGDRQSYLDRAVAALRARSGVQVMRVSPALETEPVGGPPDQGRFLNAVAELATDLGPRQLLVILLEVEAELGRVRAEKDGPRTIDLDLLLYDNLILQEPSLTLPHPRMHERRFVLEPLAAIAPAVVHPPLGRTVGELLQRLPSTSLPGSRLEPGRQVSPSERELHGLRVMVTGATGGIGRAIALELARAGAAVVVHGRRADAAAEVVRHIEAMGRQGHMLLADLSDPGQGERLVEDAWTIGDGIDAWVNNAGADTLTGEAVRWSFERKLRALLAVDVEATIALSRAVGRRMQARGGVILTMGWDQAESGMEGESGQLFAASKGAVMAFTRSLAVDLAPRVRVNCLAPGWIKTAWGDSASGSWQERVRRETPLARWGMPQDVAAAARWLISPAAAFITGQILRVNGGAVRS